MKNNTSNNLFSQFIGNVYGGLFLMLPIAVVILIGVKIYGMIFSPVRELALKLGIEKPFLVQLFLLFLLILVCFIAGLLMHTRKVTRFRDFLESGVLRFVPGYEFVRMRLSMMVGKNGDAMEKAVLVRIDDGWSPALLMEEEANGRCTVFVPDVPKSNSGSVYIVEPEQVKYLNVEFNELDIAIRNYGKGLDKIVGKSERQGVK